MQCVICQGSKVQLWKQPSDTDSEMNGFSRVILGRVTRYVTLQIRTLTLKGDAIYNYFTIPGIHLGKWPPTIEFTVKTCSWQGLVQQ